ncbi:MAG TPA: hypothetical protein VN086_00750, partial [Candidatus Paceibacterota bacterium]|nr:hypothetical protein [Candidatus Paceibacterota bacterium]
MSNKLHLMLKNLFARLILALLVTSPVLALAPVAAQASTSSSASSTVKNTGSFDADTLLVDSGEKAYLTGTSTAAKVRVIVTASSTDMRAYKTGSTNVRDGSWHLRVNKKLADGTYTVSLYQDVRGKLTLLTQNTLYVGVSPVTLKVVPIPLLAGGRAAPGSTVPISYLEVVNQSDATTTIAGFWVQEDGTAPVNSIIGFSSVDDKGNYRVSTGGIEGKTPFMNGKAYVPSGAVIAPHQMKLFTIKAQLSAYAAQYAGTSLMLN